MAQRPIVRILREPARQERKKGRRPHFPKAISSADQAKRHNHKFDGIENGIGRILGGADLKDSPAEVAPDRALVFEVIGPVSTVAKLIEAARGAGIDWLGEDYDLSDGDGEDEGDGDDAGDNAGQADDAQSMLYVTMPTLKGLQKVVSLWKRFSNGEEKPPGADGEWWALFKYLSDVRPWSAKDRVDPFMDRYVERMLRDRPEAPVRVEIDLWYRSDPDLRAQARIYVEALMRTIDGTLLDFATIEPIHYQAALVEISAAQARMLRQIEGPIANADRVMKVRPQSLYKPDGERTDEKDPQAGDAAGDANPARPAVAALLDGYPVENHVLLSGRLDIQEVDIAANTVPVVRRKHGTSMASLIVHGDLGQPQDAIDRALTVVPVLAAPQNLNTECTPPDKLPVAMVYRAVTALMEGIDGKPAQGEGIVVINHSVCDSEAPYAQRPTYWAKLLDYLSHEYRLLFVVSAGNSNEPFAVDSYDEIDDFINADPDERQIAILSCVEKAKGKRAILSPAETMNGLTVGAVHGDSAGACPPGMTEPYDPVSGVTNLTSSLGLGINRAIKPDLIELGGRQLVRVNKDDEGLFAFAHEHHSVGQLTAIPDPSGLANDRRGRATGTSNAAALTTRAAIRMADIAEGLFSENNESWVESPTRAVILKALLAHGCAWGQTGEILHNLYPGHWRRKREAVSRSLGYGQVDHDRIQDEQGHRITLLADDMIGHDTLHEYRLPIPRAMISNREIRCVTLTLAYSSPIDPVTNRYRGVLVEIVDEDGKRGFWEGLDGLKDDNKSRIPTGPVADATRKGTLQHLVLPGKKLIKNAGKGYISVGVQARADLAAFSKEQVPYSLAVTLEMAQPIRLDLNADVVSRARLKRIPIPARPRARVRT